MKNVFLIETLADLFFLYRRAVGRVHRVRIDSLDTLADAFHGFWRGKYRLILAFQHPSTVEPALWPAALANDLRRHFRRRGPSPLPFAHLVYDHRIPFWAGNYLNWLLPAVGAIPIKRGLADREALGRMRAVLFQGHWPLMMAPEGGRTWRQERWGPIEDGLGVLALWTYRDLQKAGRSEDVRILPLRCRFRWGAHTRPLWERTLRGWERTLGLAGVGPDHRRVEHVLRALLGRAGFDASEEDFHSVRRRVAQTILAQAGGRTENPFLAELRFREGSLYQPFRKTLPEAVRVQTNRLGAAELLWYLDYPWDEDFCSDGDQAWEVLESTASLAELLGLGHLSPEYPKVLRDAELITGQPFDLSQAPNLSDRNLTLEWIRERIRRDGR